MKEKFILIFIFFLFSLIIDSNQVFKDIHDEFYNFKNQSLELEKSHKQKCKRLMNLPKYQYCKDLVNITLFEEDLYKNIQILQNDYLADIEKFTQIIKDSEELIKEEQAQQDNFHRIIKENNKNLKALNSAQQNELNNNISSKSQKDALLIETQNVKNELEEINQKFFDAEFELKMELIQKAQANILQIQEEADLSKQEQKEFNFEKNIDVLLQQLKESEKWFNIMFEKYNKQKNNLTEDFNRSQEIFTECFMFKDHFQLLCKNSLFTDLKKILQIQSSDIKFNQDIEKEEQKEVLQEKKEVEEEKNESKEDQNQNKPAKQNEQIHEEQS